MNREWQNIPISDHKNFSSLSAVELKKLSEQYPYSFFHHLMLALKLKETGDTTYKKQVSKTALYANNLPWLEFILTSTNDTGSSSAHENKITVETELVDVTKSPEETINDEESIAEAEREMAAGNDAIEIPPGETSLISSILDREKEIASQESELKFEPLHTVDYFASQGIKQEADTKPADRLGKQLRSFTEWLKVMKRLPTEETAEINESEAKKIQAEAEDSNEAKEVITEAMAEVLVKQGKTQKAIETYYKLSLQHPEKSPYFAALIEQLKR